MMIQKVIMPIIDSDDLEGMHAHIYVILLNAKKNDVFCR